MSQNATDEVQKVSQDGKSEEQTQKMENALAQSQKKEPKDTGARAKVKPAEQDQGEDSEPENYLNCSDVSPYCYEGCMVDSEHWIGCDSGFCDRQWFHFECVGMKEGMVPTDDWLCPVCIEALKALAPPVETKKKAKAKPKGKKKGTTGSNLSASAGETIA